VAHRSSSSAIADGLGLGVIAAGTVPLVDPEILDLTDNDRFRQHVDYQLLVREQHICGTQVHVDVPGRDIAVAVTQRLVPWLPVLLALSASSPFWLVRTAVLPVPGRLPGNSGRPPAGAGPRRPLPPFARSPWPTSSSSSRARATSC